MKGLLLKDFYVTAKNLKIYLIIAVFFIGSAALDKSSSFLYYISVMGGMIPITLLSIDEKNKWNEYCLTLPYSHNQIVSSKYLIGIIFSAAISVISSIILLILGFSVSEVLFFFVTAVLLSFVIPAICLPFSFKFGVERGRIAYYVVLALFIGISVYLGANADENSPSVFSTIPAYITIIAPIAAVLLYILSWIISIELIKTERKQK